MITQVGARLARKSIEEYRASMAEAEETIPFFPTSLTGLYDMESP
jgi:hypothetical protein